MPGQFGTPTVAERNAQRAAQAHRQDYDRDGILEIRLSARQLGILTRGNAIEIVQPTGDTILIHGERS